MDPIGLLVFVFILGNSSGLVTSRFTANITFYTQVLQWNQARRTCEADNATLIEMATDHIYDFLQDFKTKSPWNAYRFAFGSFWIGAVVEDVLTDSYVWATSCASVSKERVQYVPAKFDDNARCLAENMNTPGVWHIQNCGALKPFVCLKRTGAECATKTLLNTGLRSEFLKSGQVEALEVFGGTLALCDSLCLTVSTCWAFVFTDPDCHRYSTTNMTGLLDPVNYDSDLPGTTLTLIECYTAILDETLLGDLTVNGGVQDIECISDDGGVTSPRPVTERTDNTITVDRTTTVVETTKTMDIMTADYTITQNEMTTAGDYISMEEPPVMGEATTTRTTTAIDDSTTQNAKSIPASRTTMEYSAIYTRDSATTNPMTTISDTSKPLSDKVGTSSDVDNTPPTLSVPQTFATHMLNPEAQNVERSITTLSEVDGTAPSLANKTPNASAVKDECFCDCLPNYWNQTDHEEFIAMLLKELTKDKSNFSSTKRKYISVNDDRPSARSFGVVGIVMLTSVLGGVVLLDLTALARDLATLKKNIQTAFGRQSSETT